MLIDRDKKQICENEVLVVSFGTASAESRRLNIDSVEKAIENSLNGDWAVHRCFSSQVIINIISKREGIMIDNVSEAVEKAAQSGVRNLAVQPTHLMKGLEYEKLKEILSAHKNSFDHISLGDPLLSSEEDFRRVADALIEASAGYDDEETALVFMGHGTEAAANDVYIRMQEMLFRSKKHNYLIGTVEAEPSLDDVLNAVSQGSYRRVILRPLMLVAGNHAMNDMSSHDDPDSWYSRFTAAGYETECIIEGLGQLPAIRDIYADHAEKACRLRP